MRERDVEKHLVERVEQLGGMVEKHVSPGRKGSPDRLVTWPGGIMHLVELKTVGGKLSPSQQRDHARRRALGVEVYVLNTKLAVARYVLWAKNHSDIQRKFKCET